MGNEISTIGGAVATAATSVAAGVTFGQVDALNNAVEECAKYTANKAEQTLVRHAGETIGSAVGVAGTAVVAGVTLGQFDCLNQAVVATAKHTAKSGSATGPKFLETANDMADGMPGVGHAKGAIHYIAGDKEGGDKAMKAASRTTGVVLGGLAGAVGGPAGVVAGGIAGGAAMDGVTTGVESAIKNEYTPNGQVQGWTNFVNGCSEGNAQAVIGGVVTLAITPAFDALTAHGAYGRDAKIKSQGYEVVPKNPDVKPIIPTALRPLVPSIRKKPWDWSPADEEDEEDEARGGQRRIK